METSSAPGWTTTLSVHFSTVTQKSVNFQFSVECKSNSTRLMAHSLVPPPSATSAIPARTQQRSVLSPLRSNGHWNCHHGSAAPQCDKQIAQFHHRRVLIYGLVVSGIGSLSPDGANAAQRRPPPPPPEEKKDPSLGGLQAKVLASKKRKEAMKEEMAKLREKGKPVDR